MMTLRFGALLVLGVAARIAAQTPVLTIDWRNLSPPTRTVITLQVVENPPLRRGAPIHDAAWAGLTALHTDDTRLALWYPYPRLAVAELAPPSATETHWDFDGMDPIVEDFFHATSGHSNVVTVSTIPTWMFAESDPGPVPASSDEEMWNYEGGSRLRDPSGTEVADYFGRVARWYTRGGFTDELGRSHISSHRFAISYWEVLNEPEYEHALSIEDYTRLYDRITAAVHAVSPATKFVGMSLAEPTREPDRFEYFLNPANHAPGTPLDAISYHFYADAEAGESYDAQQFSFFARADAFVDAVRYIESVRRRLSPRTETQVNEVGCIAASDLHHAEANTPLPLEQPYWSLCGSVFAYLYARLAEQGIEALGASQLVGSPGQFPSVSLLDWTTGAPNPRYRVLQLLHQSLGPGDRIASTQLRSDSVFAAAYASRGQARKVLLVNKRNQRATVQCKDFAGASEEFVDLTTGSDPPHRKTMDTERVTLEPFAVAIITLR